jgi:hypothetical protein
MSSTDSQPNPLERRSELGVPLAALLTVRDVLLSPAQFFSRPYTERSILPPLALAMLLQVPFGIASGAIQLTQLLAHPEVAAASHVTLPTLVVGQVLGFVLYPVIAIIVAAIQIVLLFVVGAREITYVNALRTMFYLHVVTLVYVVLAPVGIVLEVLAPRGGLLVFLIYAVIALVYVVIGLANVARTSPWRVLVAELVPLTLCCCVIPVASFMAWQAFGHTLHGHP